VTGKRFPKDGPQTNNQFAAAAGQLALEIFFFDARYGNRCLLREFTG
jgi:hypothetical protein